MTKKLFINVQYNLWADWIHTQSESSKTPSRWLLLISIYNILSLNLNPFNIFLWSRVLITQNNKHYSTYLLNIHVIKMVLNKLDSGIKISLVELIGNIPSQGAIFPSLLNCAVKKGYCIQHRPPLRHVTDIQKVLVYTWSGTCRSKRCTACPKGG